MFLSDALRDRAVEGRPVRVGVIGAGKFGSMFLAQVRTTPGLALTRLADLDPGRAHASLDLTGWPADGRPAVTDDAEALVAADDVDVVVEVTGSPRAGVRHALACVEHGKHVVMVNVEADVLVGPRLASLARSAGVGYSMAYGDQPALIAELVGWARTSGFEVVCAGKGTKYLPEYHESTPETVWDHYGFDEERVASGDYNAKMFNSFLDGTKSSIEMAAVANACELAPPSDGLRFPPVGVADLPNVLRGRDAGGVLEREGGVEVVSSLRRDGTEIADDLRWGVFVTFRTDNDYTARCFGEYGVTTDDTGRYAALYRPYHFIGLELGTSVAALALAGRPTGAPRTFAADCVAVAKRDLRAGEELDGEGGATVYGTTVPASRSLAERLLPIGLASGTLVRDVVKGGLVSWDDVRVDATDPVVAVRRLMEREAVS